ncbi:hypothetical protein QNI16_36820 [Cytophagaceae bacterium YF14B1]|uniref:Uncharacterized protein n=1 Tax=Xanthocytophaga flava TaxID=3048013 RepID=A0AAE3UAG6_9BACT|nr:hypothetical protein [Xanthocytophaga flavus]MDJ1486104.1 hypothetical protein [Xanthocytophaga flavus]
MFTGSKKLKAHALTIVVVIALVISLISGALILLAYHQRLILQQRVLQGKMERNMDSATELLLSEHTIPLNQHTGLDLFQDGRDSVWLEKQQWGIFELAHLHIQEGIHSWDKSFLYGYQPDSSQTALFLEENGLPLYLGGETTLSGIGYLPEAGHKEHTISNIAINSISFRLDKQHRSGKLPTPDAQWVQTIQKTYLNRADSLIPTKTPLSSDTLYQSFTQPVRTIYTNKPLLLSNITIRGKVLLQSDTVIRVSKSAHLEDVILAAPQIFIEDEFKGSLQAFASDSLILGNNCVLMYPTVLAIAKTKENEKQPNLRVGNQSIVKGIILGIHYIEDLKRTRIVLEADSELEGQVYTAGFLESRGSIRGGVLCHKFTWHDQISVYENHLINTRIETTKASRYFVAGNLLTSKRGKGVAKWVE